MITGTAHRKYDDLRALEPSYIEELIGRSNLSEDDRKIARCVLLHDMTYVDAGAEVGSDDASLQWHRTTASLHMRKKIAPRLRELMARDQLNMAKAGA